MCLERNLQYSTLSGWVECKPPCTRTQRHDPRKYLRVYLSVFFWTYFRTFLFELLSMDSTRLAGTVRGDHKIWCKCSMHTSYGRWVSRRTHFRHLQAERALRTISAAERILSTGGVQWIIDRTRGVKSMINLFDD